VLSIGGSLGAKSINEAIDKDIELFEKNNLQLIWQTGKPYKEKGMQRATGKQNVFVSDFITQMDEAYAAADLVISRSGAMAIAELCVVKKPVVFVPYPFAAEDHQTINAKTLVNKQAAKMIADADALSKLIADADALSKLVPTVMELAANEKEQEQLKQQIGQLGITNADEKIAEQILKTIKQ